MTESAQLRPASTVLLLRDEPGLEVLLVHRHSASPSVPGDMVFPGGKVDASDHAEGWADVALGWHDVNPQERPYRVAAVRELFEETGILLADTQLGHDELTPSEREEGGLLDLLRRRDIAVDLAGLIPFALWRTPPVVPLRFDTLFFLARAPRQHKARADGIETVGFEWLSPAEALRLAVEKQRTVVLPTRLNLQRLGESTTSADALAAAAQRPIVPVEPAVITRDGETHIHIDPRHGFGDVTERFVPMKPRPSPA